jgi:hypothetical protein
MPVAVGGATIVLFKMDDGVAAVVIDHAVLIVASGCATRASSGTAEPRAMASNGRGDLGLAFHYAMMFTPPST